MSASPVLGPFDPGHDCDGELLAGGSGAAVEDVPSRQGEEALYGRIFPHEATRPIDPTRQ